MQLQQDATGDRGPVDYRLWGGHRLEQNEHPPQFAEDDPALRTLSRVPFKAHT